MLSNSEALTRRDKGLCERKGEGEPENGSVSTYKNYYYQRDMEEGVRGEID